MAAIRYEPAAAVKQAALAANNRYERILKMASPEKQEGVGFTQPTPVEITFEYSGDSAFRDTDPEHSSLGSRAIVAVDLPFAAVRDAKNGLSCCPAGAPSKR